MDSGNLLFGVSIIEPRKEQLKPLPQKLTSDTKSRFQSFAVTTPPNAVKKKNHLGVPSLGKSVSFHPSLMKSRPPAIDEVLPSIVEDMPGPLHMTSSKFSSSGASGMPSVELQGQLSLSFSTSVTRFSNCRYVGDMHMGCFRIIEFEFEFYFGTSLKFRFVFVHVYVHGL